MLGFNLKKKAILTSQNVKKNPELKNQLNPPLQSNLRKNILAKKKNKQLQLDITKNPHTENTLTENPLTENPPIPHSDYPKTPFPDTEDPFARSKKVTRSPNKNTDNFQFPSDETTTNPSTSLIDFSINNSNYTDIEGIDQSLLQNNTESLSLNPEPIENMAENNKIVLFRSLCKSLKPFDEERPEPFIQSLKFIKQYVPERQEKEFIQFVVHDRVQLTDWSIDPCKFDTIEQFIKAIREYGPKQKNIHELYGDLSLIKQKPHETKREFSGRVHKIIDKIKDVMIANGTLDEDELQDNLAKYFKKGLRKEIRYELPAGDDFVLLFNTAREIESEINAESDEKSFKRVSFTPREEQKIKLLYCQICRDPFHEALFCPKAACVYCKDSSHVSHNCTNVEKKIILICKWCNTFGHSISNCKLNPQSNSHCQYCQEPSHEAGQCVTIKNFETCWKCKKPGHNPNNCQFMTQTNEVCDYCGMQGHNLQSCSEVICKNCNQAGHTMKFCNFQNFPKILMTQQSNQIQCYNCRGFGHISKNCPQRNGNYDNSRNKNNFQNNPRQKQSTICSYCKGTNHSIKDCYKFNKF